MSNLADIIIDKRTDEDVTRRIKNYLMLFPRQKYTKWYICGLLKIVETRAKRLLDELVESDPNIFKIKRKHYFGAKNVWLYYWIG